MEIQKLTAVSLGKKIKEKEISVREALDAVFAQIDQTEGRYHAYVTLDKEGAYKQADVVQEKIDKGELIFSFPFPTASSTLSAAMDKRMLFPARSSCRKNRTIIRMLSAHQTIRVRRR